MTYTMQMVVEAIAAALEPLKYPVYASAIQQAVELPCFFIALMPSTSASEIDDRNMTTIGLDIVFLQRPDIPNATDQIFAVVDHLNANLEFITLTDSDEETALIHTYNRRYHLEEMDLHYQLDVKLRGSIPRDENYLKTLEELNYEIKAGVKGN